MWGGGERGTKPTLSPRERLCSEPGGYKKLVAPCMTEWKHGWPILWMNAGSLAGWPGRLPAEQPCKGTGQVLGIRGMTREQRRSLSTEGRPCRG